MFKSWWIINDVGSHGCIVAETFEKADAALFLGICRNQYPQDARLVEMSEPEEDEISDDDIVWTEDAESEYVRDEDVIAIESSDTW